MDLIRDKRVKDALMNSTVQNMFARGELRKDHPLQRKPGRWNNSERSGLIATVLKDEDIDSIKVCEQLTPHGVVLWVIDGLQRLTTLNLYFNNGFKIGKNVEFPIFHYQSAKKDKNGNIIVDEYGNYEYELVEYDMRGKFYKDLPIELQERFNNYKIDMIKHLDCTDEEIGYHIRRYNKQKSMNASENAVTFLDNIAKEVKRISLNNKFFKNDTYREIERTNGTIERIIIESVMCMFHLDKWQKQGKKIGEFLNKNSSKSEFDKLNDNLNRLETIYRDEFNGIFKSKDSFIWFTLFDKFTSYGIADKKFADFLMEFKKKLCFKAINGETFDEIDKNRSTKDKTVIIKKLNVLESLMKEYLHIIDSNEESKSDEEFIFENVGINRETVYQDISQYNETLDDLTTKTIRDGSKLLNKQNRISLLAMVAYSYKVDKDLDKWMIEYAKNNNMYFADQKKNYLHMKEDFEKYCYIQSRRSA